VTNNGNQPQIFVSFAGEDRPVADRLAADLVAHGVRSFIDAKSIEVGENIITAINTALSQSDYFVLLWSRNTEDRSWVAWEWTAALTRELNERRSFLFVVRLDDTPMPAVLAPRKYLDAFGDWDAVVARLAAAWNRDRAVGTPVLPAPMPPELAQLPDSVDTAPIVLYLRNRRLSVSHVFAAPSATTGPELMGQVSAALRLPDGVAELDGLVGTRIRYQLEFAGRPITDQALAEQGVTDGSTIDLLVVVEIAGNGEIISTWIMRTALPAGWTPKAVEALIDAAFDHLRPW
jgi:hypothetical protein